MHGILIGSEEGLDAQFLFDDLEKGLSAPTRRIKLADGLGLPLGIVGDKFHHILGRPLQAAVSCAMCRTGCTRQPCAAGGGIVRRSHPLSVRWPRPPESVALCRQAEKIH